MSKTKIVTLDQPITIEKLIPGGQGLATLPDGKKGFFWNVLPGESVLEYQITKQKSKYVEAISTKIQAPSPHRITPKDSCYLSTSPWQIMDYPFELEMKRELLLESFRQEKLVLYSQDGQIPSLEGGAEPGKVFAPWDAGAKRRISAGKSVADRPLGRGKPEGLTDLPDAPRERAVLSILTDDNDYYYRNKMEYSLYYDHTDGKIHLAFHRRGSHQKIPIESSSLERPEIFQKAQEIIADLNARGEEARKYQSLLLRCNQKGEVSGGLYENGKPHPTFDNLTDNLLGHEYSYSPNGFFQINLPVYEMALKEIKKHIATENVLDLYAGVGTIGLSVARDKNLTLVEVDKHAYSELRKNCSKISKELPFEGVVSRRDSRRVTEPHNDGREGTSRKRTALANFQAILCKSEEALDFIKPDQTVILDPPRAGIDKKLTAKLLETLPETIIYLSCNPATQARDLRYLTESHKYKITMLQPYNFFPRTPHLENLVVLHRI